MNSILKPEWLKSKIGRRFALYVALIGILMALMLSLIISYQRYKDRVSFLTNELDNIITSNKSFIEESLWMMDDGLLKLVMHGFLLNEDIVFAQVRDENSKIIITYGTLDNENTIIKTTPLFHYEKGKKLLIGQLTIAASKLTAITDAEASIITTLIMNIVLMAIISLSIIYLFWHLVSKHLITIQEYRNVRFDEPQKPLVLNRPENKFTKNDELASTVDAINFMYNTAMEAYQELQKETSENIKLEQQLLHAQKMESIGRLAAGIAHDFNNVLTVIIGYTDLILASLPSDDPLYEKIQCIHDSGIQAATLTRQLLAFSRKQVLKKRVISINEIIKNFLKVLGKMAGDDVVINSNLSGKPCIVEADPGQIEQVIMNLIVNAKDAMPDGGEITIETDELQIDQEYVDHHHELTPGEYVIMSIKDTGEGIDEDIIANIFDPFFTTKQHGKGTGLGLATVYGIIKQHDGYIYAYTQKGEGTTFKIYLPLCKETGEKRERTPTKKALFKGYETILIVDDNTAICQLIEETLKPLGYNCLQASSGKDALKLFHNYKRTIHLLLTDVVMPEMSGKELAEKLKQERPEIKVIFMSGYTGEIIAKHGILEEGIHYISKPIAPDILTKKIRSVLNTSKDEKNNDKI